MREIKTFSDGTSLGWGRGAIDDWCVYYIDTDGSKNPPLDIEYFSDLLSIAEKYGRERVYRDFVVIYDSISSKNPKECKIEVIEEIVSTYLPEDQLFVNKLFTILWAAMVSEWNYMIRGKIPTKLQHRIKRLGVYTMLIKGKDPEYSANFMKNMPWYEIDELCIEDGFNIDSNNK